MGIADDAADFLAGEWKEPQTSGTMRDGTEFTVESMHWLESSREKKLYLLVNNLLADLEAGTFDPAGPNEDWCPSWIEMLQICRPIALDMIPGRIVPEKRGD